jgi:DNA-binding NarL/FixJ family response regulator
MAATLGTYAPAPDRIAVALIVDDPALRSRLRETLALADIDCAFEASSLEEASELEGTQTLDAVITSWNLSAAERLQAFKAIKQRFDGTPVVGVWPNEGSDERRALKVGIDGLIRDDQVENALAPALHAIMSGLVCVPRPIRARLEGDALSSREKQILGMLVMGFSNAQIAGRLYLAESTVKSHLSTAYTKLGVRSRKDAAALILDPDAGLGPGILAISGS